MWIFCITREIYVLLPLSLFSLSPSLSLPPHTPQSQSHGKIVRKLSKRLKVGSRKATMATMPAELLPMRPSSPVLFASRPAPLHQHSLLEQSDSGSSGNTANSLGRWGIVTWNNTLVCNHIQSLGFTLVLYVGTALHSIQHL